MTGRLLVVNDARDRGSVRLIDGNLTPPASFVRKSMKRLGVQVWGWRFGAMIEGLGFRVEIFFGSRV